jgi:hypothetical protein
MLDKSLSDSNQKIWKRAKKGIRQRIVKEVAQEMILLLNGKDQQ